jgi:hypothetical protein
MNMEEETDIGDDGLAGWVYVLEIEHTPGFLKVGMTAREDGSRIEEVAIEFAENQGAKFLTYAFRSSPRFWTGNRRAAELATHKILKRYLVPGWGREVFYAPKALVIGVAEITTMLWTNGLLFGEYLEAAKAAALRNFEELSLPLSNDFHQTIKAEIARQEQRRQAEAERAEAWTREMELSQCLAKVGAYAYWAAEAKRQQDAERERAPSAVDGFLQIIELMRERRNVPTKPKEAFNTHT